MFSAPPHSIEKALVDIQAGCTAKLAAEVAPGKQLQLLFVILPEAKGTYGKLIFVDMFTIYDCINIFFCLQVNHFSQQGSNEFVKQS